MNRNYGCCFSEFGYCPDLTAQEDTSHMNSGPRSSLLDTSDIDLAHSFPSPLQFNFIIDRCRNLRTKSFPPIATGRLDQWVAL